MLVKVLCPALQPREDGLPAEMTSGTTSVTWRRGCYACAGKAACNIEEGTTSLSERGEG